MTIASRWLDGHINMNKWPKLIHLAMNVSLVILSFDFGFRMNDLMQSTLLSKPW